MTVIAWSVQDELTALGRHRDVRGAQGPRHSSRPRAVQVPRAGMARSAGQEPAVRLTARGRVVVVLASILVGLGALVVGQSAAAEGPGVAVPVTTHVVAPGETLWGIAGAVAEPGQDLREVVDELIAVNELSGAGLTAGQRIVVPVAG
ncbi:LysM peptidoglycan-binding domain-containing protein [Actinotalea sp. BY-33]|uniref:LysM peptidoglycan-binding domain-containing protein n=1 Tax=Actinotalea soli TaxID=2819234 RepID=A0A939RT33_9CELL|nr:LysM peptidoglycan-binding domain-containing protein [Actinotalea soli]MBO1753292.1 LysM peptidoglycan-binding domain-containing protein [Actinotalea soli]